MKQETEQIEKINWKCPRCSKLGRETDIIITITEQGTKIECRECKVIEKALDILGKINSVRHTVSLDYSNEFKYVSDDEALKMSFEISQLIRDGWRNNRNRYAFAFINCDCSKGLSIFRLPNRQLIVNIYLKKEVADDQNKEPSQSHTSQMP